MLAFATFFFGLVLMYVFTTLERDQRQQRPSPVLIRSAGYLLTGVLAGAAVILVALAAWGWA